MYSVYLPIIALAFLLQGCGHKGPLYLPQKPQPNVEKPSDPTPAPSLEKAP